MIILKLDFRIFSPIFFNFKNIITPIFFDNSVASRVFAYCFTMPQWRTPIREIWRPPDVVEDVKSPRIGTMLEVDSNDSRWVHTNSVITTPPKSSYLYFRTTLQTSEGDFTITVSPSGIGSGLLVGLYYRWFSCHFFQTHYSTPGGLRATYLEYFRPLRRFVYGRQRSRFHPSAVGERLLVCHQFIEEFFS